MIKTYLYQIYFLATNSQTSLTTNLFFGIISTILSLALAYLFLSFSRFFRQTYPKNEITSNHFDATLFQDISLIVPIHYESKKLLEELTDSLKKIVYIKKVVIFLCPSNNNKDSEFLDELSLSKFNNIEFHIFKASQNGKAIKIAEV